MVAHLSLWRIFRCSRAANSTVSGPIWLKFKLVKDIMHVLITCKVEKGQINSNQGKVKTTIFWILKGS